MQTLKTQHYDEGQKVRFSPDGTVYDFGYYSATPGKCVVYVEGESNLQDAVAVSLSDIEPVVQVHD